MQLVGVLLFSVAACRERIGAGGGGADARAEREDAAGMDAEAVGVRRCGDRDCTLGETCTSCASDCGACEGEAEAESEGDGGVLDAGDGDSDGGGAIVPTDATVPDATTPDSASGPWCGDGVCDGPAFGECAAFCPSDCAASCGDGCCDHKDGERCNTCADCTCPEGTLCVAPLGTYACYGAP